MNFTREPIIETIISAKDGHKLSIKSSKNLASEEYLVDAVEVVSFGGTFFYRSQERVKAFFLPSNDYEIQEVKETRVLIKNPTLDKSVKIAGGKEANIGVKSVSSEISPAIIPSSGSLEEEVVKGQEQKREKKQRYKKNRRQNGDSQVSAVQTGVVAGESVEGAPPVAPSIPQPGMFSHLLKPPERLISDTLGKYRQERSPTVPVEPSETIIQKEVDPVEAGDPSIALASSRTDRYKKNSHSHLKPKKEMIAEHEQLVSEAPQGEDIIEERESLISTSVLSTPAHRELITTDMIDEMDRPPLDHQE